MLANISNLKIGGREMSRPVKDKKEPEKSVVKEKEREGIEKEKAINQAILQIEKQFGKGSIMTLGQNFKIDVPAIPTGAIALDVALGVGGIPRGRVIEIFGPESSGKTTLTLSIIAQAQKRK